MMNKQIKIDQFKQEIKDLIKQSLFEKSNNVHAKTHNFCEKNCENKVLFDFYINSNHNYVDNIFQIEIYYKPSKEDAYNLMQFIISSNNTQQ